VNNAIVVGRKGGKREDEKTVPGGLDDEQGVSRLRKKGDERERSQIEALHLAAGSEKKGGGKEGTSFCF